MAQPTYTRTNMRDVLNSRVHGKLSNLIDANEILNSAVRFVINDADLRGSKRRAILAPNVFDDVYSYTLPTDVKGNKLIDVIPQVKLARKPDWDLVPEDYFERLKEYRDNLISIADDDLDRRLLISRVVQSKKLVLGEMESLTGDGDTWVGFGTTNDSDVKQDQNDYISGNASLRFQDDTADLAGTTVGIQNKGLGATNLSEYLAGGSVFVRGRLTTGDTNITQLNVRLGSDTSNYYAISDSTTNENTPFATGWNLVRLDLSGKTATASPVDTAIDYAAVYWTKTAGQHINDTNYGFDILIVAKGQIHDLVYYSRYLWQTTGGTYQENSSANTDRINVFNDEFELIITKAWELAAIELRDYDDVKLARVIYDDARIKYELMNPSEAMILLQPSYEFETAPVNYRGSTNDSTST